MDENEQLWKAIATDDICRAHNLLAGGVSTNAHASWGCAALMEACFNRNKALVELLLRRGSEMKFISKRDYTPLMYAALRGHEAIFNMLRKYNADVMMKDWEGLTVAHWAALGNSKAILDRLLIMRQCKITVDMEDNHRRTPLWHAACHGHLDCVHILLAYGAIPDHESKYFGSPLHIAKRNGHTTVVSIMTESLTYSCFTCPSPSFGFISCSVATLSNHLVEKDKVISDLKEKIRRLEEEKKESDIYHWRVDAMLRKEVSRLKKEVLFSEERNMTNKPEAKQDISCLDPESVLQAVICYGCDQWYSLCVQMGYSSARVLAITDGMPSKADKISVIFDKKVSAVGQYAATQALLDACKSISDPIIGGVLDSLFK